jgi:hypothetical protein
MWSFRRDPFAWMEHGLPSGGRPVPLSVKSYLRPLDDGAMLAWRFDETDIGHYYLCVRLTEREAQKVYEADESVGMLEPVRAHLRHPGSLIVLIHDAGLQKDLQLPYLIPTRGSEYDFVCGLMKAADRIAQHDRGAAHNLHPRVYGARIASGSLVGPYAALRSTQAFLRPSVYSC